MSENVRLILGVKSKERCVECYVGERKTTTTVRLIRRLGKKVHVGEPEKTWKVRRDGGVGVEDESFVGERHLYQLHKEGRGP